MVAMIASSPAALAPAAAAQPKSSAAEIRAQLWRAEQRAQARPTELFTPFFLTGEHTDTRLFLLDEIADPVDAEVTALTPDGDPLPLGTVRVEPGEHLELSLRDRLPPGALGISQGSVRVSFLGDKDTLRAWAVLEEGMESLEIPLQTREEVTSTTLLSFWDMALGGIGPPAEVEYFVLNAGSGARTCEIEAGRGPRVLQRLRRTLRPNERMVFIPSAELIMSGWVRLTHGGDPGDLIMHGLLRRGADLVELPAVTPGQASKGPRFESMPVAPESRGNGSPGRVAALSLFNPGGVAQRVLVETLDASTGTAVATRQVLLGPKEVRSVMATDLPDRLSPSGAAHGARIRVVGELPGLLVQGSYRTGSSGTRDLAFFAASDAHGGGTYPLPDPTRYATATTLVNLGDADAMVVAQAYWAGGTFALEPFVVPARGDYRLDPEAIAALGQPDLLGRQLDPAYPNGVLKWIVHDGSREIIARTEALRIGGFDPIGFNCFGCCWETPHGEIAPSSVSFLPSEDPVFQACVSYDTCSGTMGPYATTYTSASVPAPFHWDGTNISTSAPADATITFNGSAEEVKIGICDVHARNIFGFGSAKTCQKTFNPHNYDPGKTCVMQTTGCEQCVSCCNDIKAMETCQNKRLDEVLAEYSACLGHCTTDWCM